MMQKHQGLNSSSKALMKKGNEKSPVVSLKDSTFNSTATGMTSASGTRTRRGSFLSMRQRSGSFFASFSLKGSKTKKDIKKSQQAEIDINDIEVTKPSEWELDLGFDDFEAETYRDGLLETQRFTNSTPPTRRTLHDDEDSEEEDDDKDDDEEMERKMAKEKRAAKRRENNRRKKMVFSSDNAPIFHTPTMNEMEIPTEKEIIATRAISQRSENLAAALESMDFSLPPMATSAPTNVTKVDL